MSSRRGRYAAVRIDIGGNDVGFHFVGGNLLGDLAWFTGLIMVKSSHARRLSPKASKGHCRPDRRMRVLPAVFSNSRDIPFD